MQHPENAQAAFAAELQLFFRGVQDEGFYADIKAAEVAGFWLAHFINSITWRSKVASSASPTILARTMPLPSIKKVVGSPTTP